ncbi:alpha/beta fold hydrolase [Roseovarius spongiae]|uniref:Alpha/beta fold hydrolase n=1 Tax=Roseovarius spongiae TaxID=2320272 RepID=A0A3A8B7G7_9RHOB|nr:alpha/beta fold hydrolase [Roseovarius spongiae]RKF12571.1 alpha/beta fold hydrolase [Roseovarius spongiae]
MPQHVNRQGHTLHYLDEGSGPPVILVHGVGSNLHGWDEVLAHLPATRRHLRPDLRGHGRSERVSGPYTLAGMAADIVDLADHLDLNRFALAGFSLGGLIAQRIALDHPGRLSALALLSTIAGRNADERERVLARRDILAREGPLTHLANAVDRWFTPEFVAANPGIIAARRKAAMRNDPACYMAAYNVLAENDLGEQIRRIAAPTLIMTGEHDIGSNARMARFMHERIEGSELHILSGLKHSILLEAPGLVARHLSDFLEAAQAKELK